MSVNHDMKALSQDPLLITVLKTRTKVIFKTNVINYWNEFLDLGDHGVQRFDGFENKPD